MKKERRKGKVIMHFLYSLNYSTSNIHFSTIGY